jgi:chromosome segregation ATPase
MKTKSELAKKQEEYDALALKEKACQEELTKLKEEKTALDAQLATLTTDLAAANEKRTALEAQLNTANESIRTLNEALAAANEAKGTAEAALAAANEAKTAAEAALIAANEAKTAATTTLATLQEELRLALEAKTLAETQLAAANTTIEDLTTQLRDANERKAALEAQVIELGEQKADLEAQVNALNEQVAEKDVEITELNRQKLQLETQLNALLEVVPGLTPIRLRELLDSEGLVDTLNEQIAELRRQLAACPSADEVTRLQALVTELQRRPTQEAYDELQRSVEQLNTKIQEQNASIEQLQPFADLVRQLEGLLKEELTLERFAELLRAEEAIAGLRARITELEGRPNITQSEYETLEGQLRDARTRIQELQGRGDISQTELEELQKNYERAVDQFEDTLELLNQAQRGLETAKQVIKRLQSQRAELEGLLQAANAKLADCEKVKTQLADTQLQLEAKKTEVRNLTRKIEVLEERIQKSSGDATRIQGLQDQQTILQAALEKSKADLAASQKEVERLNTTLSASQREVAQLNTALAAAIAERDARPTQQALNEITAQRNSMKAERNAAVADKEKVSGERNAAVADREKVAGERNAAVAAREKVAEERNAAVADREKVAEERNAAVAAREKVAGERNAAVAAQQALQTKVSTLEEQIRTQGVYKVVYTRLKELLGIRDDIELPNESQVDSLLGTVQERIRGAPSTTMNKTHLCLLHLLYTLLRRLTSKQGITTDSGLRYRPEQVQAMFTSIQGKTATPINESVLSIFSHILKKLLQVGFPRGGEFEVYTALELPLFTPMYAQLESLLGNAPFFTSENKACASAFLNQFFVSEYDFTTLYLKSNGHLKVKQEGEDLGLVSVASLFLLVLTATQQILVTNQADIEAAGCAVPQVDLRPAPIATPVIPEPQPLPAVLPEEARCRPGIVPGTDFRRRPMPGPVKFDQWKANDLEKIRDLYTYLRQVKSSDAPVGPLCKLSIDRLPSEFDTYTKLVHLYSERPLWHIATLPYKRDAGKVDPASIGARAGILSGRGGTRKRKPVKPSKTKKMRKT